MVAARLRKALAEHFELIEQNTDAYFTLMNNRSAPDPTGRAITEDVRWLDAAHLVHAPERTRPVLRTCLRGWTGYLDELAIDYLRGHELSRDQLVELAATALVSSLRAAYSLDPKIEVDRALIGLPAG